MAPKKKQQKQKSSSSSSNANPKSSSSSGPKLQISLENENRLRRLLLTSGRSSTTVQLRTPADESLSREQKSKRLRTVYEKLSCEGFSNDQIELALSAIKDGTTFEAALDWLCLNIPGKELPTKFSAGTNLHANEGGAIGIISTAQDDRITPVDISARTEEPPEAAIMIKQRSEDDTLDSRNPSQADWIRQYMEQQEEDEHESWEDYANDMDSSKEVSQTNMTVDSIVHEYHKARLEATNAKARRDKVSQEQAGKLIRKLKQEMAKLGLSDDILDSHNEISSFTDLNIVPNESMDSLHPMEAPLLAVIESAGERNAEKISSLEVVTLDEKDIATVPDLMLDEDIEDVELGDFFLEDFVTSETLPPTVVNLQKKEQIRKLSDGKNLEKLGGIWKKGDPPKIPKAVLQQLCQKSEWEAPKYNKVLGKKNNFSYTVSVLRKGAGRGKNRKSGGLVTVQLPDPYDISESPEDAQNRVAAFALNSLFPDLPVHLLITEPYASLVLRWDKGEMLPKFGIGDEDRRTDFIDSLLNIGGHEFVSSVNALEGTTIVNLAESSTEENVSPVVTKGQNHYKEGDSINLRREHESKKKMQKYKDMLACRAALPIMGLKDEILRVLKENNVLVVCGETGSGKTTQVPQYILDDMIEADQGGYCNIICTQPRRIAAISVAERVSDERCESSPGSNGSLVGYQVRLDSARSEKTKLMFCTTGILLRRIAGDKTFSGVTHVIVDEVHERSLLGDFLLIVLKNLIAKQSDSSTQRLKVILMSATVDSDLFSRYFGNCPVVTAQGRMHPVSTCYLEDIYESINYRLPSDSAAYISSDVSKNNKSGLVTNRRGKKNLLLSGWGDESLLSEDYTNPYYIPSDYQTYSERTRQNLRKLNEDVIDYDLLEDLVHYIDETHSEGAILVFLPGLSEIHILLDKLAASSRFGGLSADWILALHSSVSSNDQKRAFLRPPDNIRKVVLATNIAETSITIDDVVYVIDSGRHKENRYNPLKKLSSMVEDWISQANARQRRGRAGRVKPGVCFCLYTRHRFEKIMRPFQIPEILRMPLVELCLQIKLLSFGSIKAFLLKALEPPREEAINSAVSLLYEVGAIGNDEELTPLGYHLAKLPVDVLIGKMLIYGGIFGCLSPILSISAFLSHKSPFIYPKDERQNAETARLALLTDKLDGGELDDGNKNSDHLLMMVAYSKWNKILHERGDRAAKQFCSKYFLSSSVMHMIRDMRIQFGTLLADIGLINSPKSHQVQGNRNDKLDNWFSDMSQPFNMYAHYPSVVKAIICAGLYPNLAATEDGLVKPPSGSVKFSSTSAIKGRPALYDGKREVHIHPSSINSTLQVFQHPFIVFLEKVETNKIFLRDTTIVSPYSVLLFGGPIDVQHQTGVVTIDGWIKLAAPAQTAVLFKELRITLHSFMKDMIKNPQAGIIANNEVVRTIVHLLLEQETSAK
ncbi:DExH-box ATP-dependent RNA helicase DExH7, chloroplastic [Impatiens glandulifera]|uniref:DExH-box ATP-dependent RNA helicase DExH7, chloroplastic n=1 Tax=Impatiens glandulifera TaxID=253017 RepID=UPI001FB100F8|nr:DExH-box ATP-dependent RNA helicase DExH7, chloroplastic [Impatiens glandulifera]